MAVLVSCSLPAEDFALSAALGDDASAVTALDLVGDGDAAPFAYARVAADAERRVDAALADSARVDAFERVDDTGDSVLYRVEWQSDGSDVLDGVVAAGATLLDATGDDRWTLLLQFVDHDYLAEFYNYCTTRDVAVTLDWVVPLPPDDESRHLAVTPEQRETLVLALHEGYFGVPSETSTSELAAELGVSQQAVSQRIRRGTERVLRATLLDEES